MDEAVDTANEQIGEAHEKDGERDPWPRRMAVVVSVLAASLALSEIGAKSTQNAYLTNHIAASDTWNEYQAKNLRASLRDTEATLLSSLPAADDPTVRERIKAARDEAGRMRDEPVSGDGMIQLRDKARRLEQDRDAALESYHGYEHTSGGLEISIVLASVSVVTRIRALGIAAALIGLIACIHGLAVRGHLI
jgi:Domain of unknown function (DUF4337)